MENKKQPQQRPPGFNCPQCNFFIELSIESLLYEDNHKCPGCGTIFMTDRAKSKDAMELVQKLQVAMKNLDSVKKFKGG